MLKPGEAHHKFKNLTARWYLPRVIYFLLEWLLFLVYGPQPDPQKSRSQTIEIHQMCIYASAVFEFGKKYLLNFELKRGPNVMEELISSLESLARQFYAEKKTLLFHRYDRPATAKCDGLLDMREQFLSTKIKWYLIIAITPSRS